MYILKFGNKMEKPPEENIKKNSWDWKEYYELIGEKGYTKNLETAISYCKERDYALDMGAGNLRDTKFLLDQGFKVTAIDISKESERLAKELNNQSLKMFTGRIGQFDFPENYFLLINAQGILFHVHKDSFEIVLSNIKKSLKTGGVLCADFIGEKDDWNYEGGTKSILTKENLTLLEQDFEIKSFKEYERDETQEVADKKALYKDDKGYKPKHWHHIDIIAMKK